MEDKTTHTCKELEAQNRKERKSTEPEKRHYDDVYFNGSYIQRYSRILLRNIRFCPYCGKNVEDEKTA
jgi:hypothetical protein